MNGFYRKNKLLCITLWQVKNAGLSLNPSPKERDFKAQKTLRTYYSSDVMPLSPGKRLGNRLSASPKFSPRRGGANLNDINSFFYVL